jgi:restriction endonuclease Mrr
MFELAAPHTSGRYAATAPFTGARKGLILTASSFANDAVEFVERIEGKEVVLIDGDQSVDVMIDHNSRRDDNQDLRDQGCLEPVL